MKFLKEPGSSRLFYFLILVLSLLSTAWLWSFLREFSDPSGANGYFYLKQTETLAGGLGFYFKDYSLAFLLPVFFMKLTGDSLTAFQLSICTVSFSLIWTCAILMRNLLQPVKTWYQVLLIFAGALAIVCTAQLYEFNLTFFKNAFAVNLVVWGWAVVFWPTGGFKKALIAAGLFLAALLSHKSMLLLLALGGAAWLLQKLSFKRALLFGGGFGCLLAVFLWQFEKASAYLKVLVRFFTGPEGWWRWFARLQYTNMEMRLSIFALVLAFVLYLVFRRRVARDVRVFTDAAAVLLIVALQPFQIPGPNGPSYRLILLAPVFGIPLLVVMFSTLRKYQYLGVLPLSLFLVQPFMDTKFLDDVFTPWAVIREDVLKIKNFVNPEDHLTSHHGLEFFIDYATGIRSRSFLSDHPEKRDFRVAYVDETWLRHPDTQQALRARALLEIGSEYILLPETDWQEMVKQYKIPFHWKNPNQHRPDYIYE